MPDRILRDEILDSERWLSVECAAKLAFIACVLKADAMGNLDAQPTRLFRLWRDFGCDTVEASEAVLKVLETVDLVRIYPVDNRRFIHIPRFGQRLRYVGNLHPKSPWDKIPIKQKQDVTENSPGDSQARTRRSPAEVKRSEVNLNHGLPNPTIVARATEPPKTETVLKNNGTSKPATNPTPDLPREWWKDDAKTDQAGRLLATQAKVGESYPDYRTRLFEVIAHRNRGTDPPAPRPPRQPPEAILQNILDQVKHRPA